MMHAMNEIIRVPGYSIYCSVVYTVQLQGWYSTHASGSGLSARTPVSRVVESLEALTFYDGTYDIRLTLVFPSIGSPLAL